MKEFSVWIPMVEQQQVELVEAIITAHEVEASIWLTTHPSTCNRKSEIGQLLIGVRAVEGGQQAHQSITPRFENRTVVTGNSWQLAIAIADKMVRLNAKAAYFIVATGAVDSHDLMVLEVGDFSKKLAFLADYAQKNKPRNPVFVYPTANKEDFTDSDKEALTTLKQKGWQIHGISNLSDVQFLWEQKKATTSSIGWQKQSLIVTSVLLLVSALLVWYKQCYFVNCSIPPPVPPSDSPFKPIPRVFNFNFTYRKSADEHTTEYTLNSGEILNESDEIKLHFFSLEQGYLYLYYLDSKGNLTEFFTKSEQFNLIESGKNLVLPAENHSFVVDDTHGTEKFYLIFSKQLDIDIYPLFQQSQLFVKQGRVKDGLLLQQQVISKLEKYNILTFYH
ncbi:DUF4384 domain-containing protein [Beggiatoa leptomitoformis]|uniref:DUF4384 domain-containing protein n=1 Tax=Beggiatoa leptomitoformis TaxID=288004 RepID=A0A2N9YBG3_9GAMM|nr:DUF4384 domain-containing protein [Beggiatoa leptomitoformis]ALG66873.1 DUF4384 domain-containing protein [Beggiatoa leptomitoformis]AUI67772.1 DUF4384 domain-containing protein [Beggiatoa leptomitoformis]